MAVVAGFVSPAKEIWDRRSNLTLVGDYLSRSFTGWDPITKSWNLANMRTGAFPVLGGFAVHMIANRLGLNRVLARNGVPFLRI